MFFKSTDILFMSFKDLRGQKFNRLTAIGIAGRNKHRYIIWTCLCDCGKLKEVTSTKLRRGDIKSCGCLQKERSKEVQVTHGKSSSRIYSIWCNMLTRCFNSNHDAYSDYGGRGIKVCERWRRFENFFIDMGEPPEGLTLDRIDVNGNYEPGNCKWATWSEQNLNKRN